MEGQDIDNIRIIVFRRLNQFEIGGNVITASEFVPTLKVSSSCTQSNHSVENDF